MAARLEIALSAACLVCCGASPVAPASSAESPTARPVTSSAGVPAKLISEALALPGAVAPVSLDYLFFEPQRARVWVPAGGTGSVDVLDVAAHEFSRVAGFETAERELHGKKRTLGPSSGAVGDGFAYVGNRATQEVCVIDLLSLQLRSCLKLSSAPDGVEFCQPTREVWVTTPSAHALVVLDASSPGTLSQKATIQVDGEPEGYAVDPARGLFLTNLEDKGSTLALDLKSHAVSAEWHAGCSNDGPRGLAVDAPSGMVMVACTDHVQVLDQAHQGALLGRLDTGPGLDNLDYHESERTLYAAAGKAASLTVARLQNDGQLSVIAIGATAPGARNAVADANGNAYVADAQGARLLVLSAVKR